MIGLTEYFAFYNIQRPHQSLGQIPPDAVYRSWIGGGAMILDKYPRTEKDKKSGAEVVKESPASDARVGESAKAGQRRPAASEVKCTA
jgi:putative transposase